MPRFHYLAMAMSSLTALAACESEVERQADATGDRTEQQAERSAANAGAASAAFGLTETQLLEADLVSVDGTDLGDVAQIRRDADGSVDGLLVELENTDPDRYVLIPVEGLSTQVNGKDTDLQTSLTAAQLEAMPDAIR